jgi:hypothetical protein
VEAWSGARRERVNQNVVVLASTWWAIARPLSVLDRASYRVFQRARPFLGHLVVTIEERHPMLAHLYQ